jgi:hypothetical protein
MISEVEIEEVRKEERDRVRVRDESVSETRES